MKQKIFRLIAVILIPAAAMLFLSGIIPEAFAKASAARYLKGRPYGEYYRAEYAEYSPAHDSWFVYFSGGPNPLGEPGTTRHIGVYYRWIPFFVWYDSMNPG